MSQIIELEYPIVVDGVEVSSVTMRRLKVADLMAYDKMKCSEAERDLRTLANICELPPAALQEMDAADYLELREVMQGFLSRAQKSVGKGV
jgi:hypothetical protein